MVQKIKGAALRNILLIIAVVAFGYVLISNRENLSETWQLLKNVDIRLALILPLLQLVSYFFISGYYRSFIKSFGAKISWARAFGTTTALNFVNQILPSGGASGTTYLIYAFKDKARPGQLTLIQVGRYVLAMLTYVPLLIIAYASLLAGDLLNTQLNVVFWIVAAISLPGAILVLLGIRNQKLVDAIAGFIIRVINAIARTIFRRKQAVIDTALRMGFLKEFHEGIAFIRERGRHVIKPYIFMLLSTITEIAIVFAAFTIVGVDVEPSVIVIAFAAANLVGAISIIPGDIGVHELTIITVLSYIGISSESAIAGTLLYRVFNKIVVMGIGFIFYIKYLKPIIGNVSTKESENHA